MSVLDKMKALRDRYEVELEEFEAKVTGRAQCFAP